MCILLSNSNSVTGAKAFWSYYYYIGIIILQSMSKFFPLRHVFGEGGSIGIVCGSVVAAEWWNANELLQDRVWKCMQIWWSAMRPCNVGPMSKASAGSCNLGPDAVVIGGQCWMCVRVIIFIIFIDLFYYYFYYYFTVYKIKTQSLFFFLCRVNYLSIPPWMFNHFMISLMIMIQSYSKNYIWSRCVLNTCLAQEPFACHSAWHGRQ